jgi:glutathione peroxidase
MFKILLAITLFTTSLYSLSFNDAAGNTVSMSAFKNKKILLVNISTSSKRVAQLEGLQQLQETFGDSLVVVAFPSNSFTNDSLSSLEVLSFCQRNYRATFPIAQKNPVSGTLKQPIYQWLSDSSLNGTAKVQVSGDFHKVLINSEGEIVGLFSPVITPTDSVIIKAIIGHRD